jgi:hypothetical protein
MADMVSCHHDRHAASVNVHRRVEDGCTGARSEDESHTGLEASALSCRSGKPSTGRSVDRVRDEPMGIPRRTSCVGRVGRYHDDPAPRMCDCHTTTSSRTPDRTREAQSRRPCPPLGLKLPAFVPSSSRWVQQARPGDSTGGYIGGARKPAAQDKAGRT